MHKIAIHLGPLTIHWYGVLVAAGFLAGLWTASRRGLRDQLSPEKMVDLGTWVLIGALVGSRVWFVVSYWNEVFAAEPWWKVFMIQEGGLVFYGGLVGASLTVIFYTQWKGLPLWRIADAFAPSVALGHVFGRMGCLMNGCCYGRPTDLPWAIHFPLEHETHGVGVHPTEIYESLLNLGLYAALAWAYRRKTFDGQIFALYLIAYAFLRSLVECFRGDYPVRYLGGYITPGQLMSIAIVTAGILLYAKLPRQAAARKAG